MVNCFEVVPTDSKQGTVKLTYDRMGEPPYRVFRRSPNANTLGFCESVIH